MGNKNNFVVEGTIISMSIAEGVISLGGYFIFLFLINKGIDFYNLVKVRNPKKIKKVKLPQELKVKCDEVDLDRLSKKLFGECLVNFSNVITKNFKKETLTNFYNNINSLETKIKEIDCYKHISEIILMVLMITKIILLR